MKLPRKAPRAPARRRPRADETSFFVRRSRFVIEMGGPRPNVVRRAFELAVGELDSVVERGKDPACYVVLRAESRAAEPAAFEQWASSPYFSRAVLRRGQALQSWLDSLAEANPLKLDEQPQDDEAEEQEEKG